jgi:hypothetical protein
MFDDINAELQAMQQYESRRQQADQAVANVSDADVSRAVAINDFYKWLPPAMSFGLSAMGFGPNDQRVQDLATNYLTAQAQKPGGIVQPGDTIDASHPASTPQPGQNPLVDQMRTNTVKMASKGILPVPDGATEEGPSGFAGLAGNIGSSILSGAQSTFNSTNPLTDAGNVLKGAVRASDTAFKAVPQVLQASARVAQQNWQQGGILGELKGAVDPMQFAKVGLQTDVAASAAQMMNEGTLDQGSGFFNNDTKTEGQFRHDAELAFGPTITNPDGSQSAATIGRQVAGLVRFEPGSRESSILSGLVDGLVNIAGLKIAEAPQAAAKAADAFKTLEATRVAADAGPIARTLDSVGAIMRPGSRATLDLPTAVRWLDGGDGQKVADFIAQTDNARDLSRTLGGKLPVDTLKAFTEAATPEAAKTAMLDAIGAGGMRSTVPVTLGQVGGLRNSLGIDIADKFPTVDRLGGLVPHKLVDPSEPDKGLATLDQYMQQAKMPVADRDGFFNRWVGVDPKLPLSAVDPVAASKLGPFDPMPMVTNPLAVKDREQVVRDVLNNTAGRLLGEQSGLQAKIDELAGLESRTPVQNRVLSQMQDDLAQRTETVRNLVGYGISRDAEDTMYNIDAANRNNSFFGAVVGNAADGATQVIQPAKARPDLIAETIGGKIVMPDPQDLRQAFNHPLTQALLNIPGVDKTKTALEAIQSNVWVPAQLTRAATAIRIIGDSQARLATQSMPNFFTHPIQALGWAIADPALADRGPLGKALNLIPAEGHGGSDILGRQFSMLDDFKDAMNVKDARLYQDVNYTQRLDGYRPVTYGQPTFTEAWHGNLGALHVDPVTQMMAKADTLDQAKNFWWNEMAPLREKWAALNPEGANPLTGVRSGQTLLDRAGADAYIDHLNERIHIITQGDPRLLDALKTGSVEVTDPGLLAKMRDADLIPRDADTGRLPMYYGQGQPNPLFQDWLSTEADQTAQNFRTQAIVGRRLVEPTAQDRNIFETASRWAFAQLLGNPDDIINRSTTARNFYWQNAQTLAPQLSKDTVDEFLANAEKANLGGDQLKTLRAVAGTGDGNLTLDQAHHLATAQALDDTQGLLHNLSERHALFDALRVVAPFGEAWGQIIRKWGGLMADNPQLAAGASEAFRALRSPDVGSVVGAPDVYDPVTQQTHQGGFFFPDTNGNEVFAWPLTSHLSSLIGGAPIPLVSSVKGLSIGTEVLPGLGPVATIPTAATFQHLNDPGLDWLHNLILPRGDPQGGLFTQVTADQLPTWMRTLANVNGGTDPRTWNNQVADAKNYLASTGQYKTSGPGADPQEINRLVNDAKHTSMAMSFLRTLGQFTLPSSPAYQWAIEDKTGQRLPALVLAQELHDLESSPDPNVRDNATATFLQRHGQGALALLQGKTVTVSPGGGLPPTKEAADWLATHGTVNQAYPQAYGFFAPHTPGAAFDQQAYNRSLTSGERLPVTPDIAMQLANRSVAEAKYYSVRNTLGASLNAQQSQVLYDLRQKLEQQYPGYSANGDEVPGTPKKATKTEVIKQLQGAVTDPSLADNPLTKPLGDYFRVRNQAQQVSTASTGKNESWSTSAQAADIRRTMYTLGSKLAASSPEFQSVWESVLLPEFDKAMVTDGQQGR